MIESKWVKGFDKCSRCNQTTEQLETIHDGLEYVDGERCVPCGWVIIFEEDSYEGTAAPFD